MEQGIIRGARSPQGAASAQPAESNDGAEARLVILQKTMKLLRPLSLLLRELQRRREEAPGLLGTVLTVAGNHA